VSGRPGAEHTSKHYEQELADLRDKLLTMGSLGEEMIVDAMRALAARDAARARATIEVDRRIDRLECEADELAMKILATRQPVASDLRFLTAALKIVTDLERIGDLAVNICERVVELCQEPPLPVRIDLGGLADEATGALHEALDALVARDVDHATELLRRDDVIDAHYSAIFADVLRLMSADGTTIFRATRVQSIAKYLERVADHAMNVSETVVLIVKGKDIRHRRPKDDGPAA
jgi:phosphate transport system protein